MKARWNNGLWFESTRGDFQTHLGGQVNQDWVFFSQPDALRADPTVGDLDDGVFFRRARIIFDGRWYETVDWYLEVEWGAATDVTFGGAWVGMHDLPYVGNLRIGNVKQAFGLESNTGSRYLTFLEPAATYDTFHQEYDPGVWLQNAVLGDHATWAIGGYRVDPEDDAADFGDGEYALATRLTATPWYDEPAQGRYLAHVGVSYAFRDAEFNPAAGRDVVRLRGRPEVRAASLLPRFVDSGSIAADQLELAGAEAAVVLGPLSVQGEFVAGRASDAVSLAGPGGTPRGDVTMTGYYVFASWFVTGENRAYNRKFGSFSRLVPRENFFCVNTNEGVCRGSGAWEFAARYSALDLAESGIEGGRLGDVTLGVNWYLNPNLKVQWNYLWIDRQAAPPRASGLTQAVAMRLALDF